MNYLTKNISKIFLIDFFTEQERLSSDNQITTKLEALLTDIDLSVQSFYPNSEDDFIESLTKIESQNLEEGVIVHLIGHGGEAGYFGNGNFIIYWNNIRQKLLEINSKANDGLIVNASIMCYGHNIFQLIDGKRKPFFAAIASLNRRGSGAYFHNKHWYETCIKYSTSRLQSINPSWWLDETNNGLECSLGNKQYELMYAEQSITKSG